MPKRQLTVIQPTQDTDVAADKPTWQWALIGGGLVFALWLPLVVVSLWLVAQITAKPAEPPSAWMSLLTILPIAASYAIACIAGGWGLKHFATALSGRASALAGAACGTLACGIALIGGELSPWLVALGSWLALAGGGAALTWLGWRLGRS